METTNIPNFWQYVYLQSSKRTDIYDLQAVEQNPKIFTYFRLSTSRKPFLIKQGAKYVIESWKGATKTSFTGLIKTLNENWYLGDLVLLEPEKQPLRSFLLVYFEGKIITLYIFSNFKVHPPYRETFCKRFIHHIKQTRL